MIVQPKATALLYTVRTLGVALGVSIGGSIQIGALTTHLKLRFADHPDVDQVSTRPCSGLTHLSFRVARVIVCDWAEIG